MSKDMQDTGYMVVERPVEEAGAMVFWRLSGSLDLAKLKAAWATEGLEEKLLPDPPSEQVALKRAIRDFAESRRLVRPLEHRAGWSIVVETAKGDALEYSQALTVKLNGAGQPVCDPAEHPAAGAIEAAYTHNLDNVSQGDVSGWLCRLMDRVDAVSLRDTGGVYFVPRHCLDRWRAMVRAIRSASAHAVFGVPAMPADETVAAVLDAITNEAMADVTALADQLAKGELGERAMESRLTKTNSIELKLGRYEALLGTKLEDVRAKLDAVRQNLTVAILTASPQAKMAV
jgi:hypothetical protein